MNEPGFPHFDIYKVGGYKKYEKFDGAHATNYGLWRLFPCLTDSPHEPWCLHFEWGPCSCGPNPDEVFLQTGTVYPPKPSWWRRLRRKT
jgi:hypothetical protein